MIITSCVMYYLKNDSSDEFIGEVILKINIILAEKAKVYVNDMIFITYKITDTVVISFVFSS